MASNVLLVEIELSTKTKSNNHKNVLTFDLLKLASYYESWFEERRNPQNSSFPSLFI